jgi:glycosyltransferase involved in cell wall biosynthesis
VNSRSILFSLLVPSYDRPELIRETINSLLANAAEDVEIIVSDDASPRQSEIMASLEDLVEGKAIRFISQPVNLGWSNNRNALVRTAKGEWLLLLGDDDRLKPYAVTRLRDWIARQPEADIFGLGYDIIDEEGRRVFTRRCPRLMRYHLDIRCAWKELFYFDAVAMWSHHPFTMLTRRSVFSKLAFNPAAGIGDDSLFLFQALGHRFTFVVLPEVLFEWRNRFGDGSYAPLSSQERHLKESKAAVLGQLLCDAGLPADIASLVRSEKFMARFLLVSDGDAARLARMVRGEEWSKVVLQATDLSCTRRESVLEKTKRHCRCVAAMGPRHLLQLFKYFRDKGKLGQRLAIQRGRHEAR